MDCFAEFIIGRRFAPTRWLAMTAERRLRVRDKAYAQSTKITLTSLTLVSVGPVSSRSPVAAKNAVASLLSR